MAERIRRAELNQLIRAWKGGGFDSLNGVNPLNFQRMPKVIVHNISGSTIQIGDRVYVSPASSATFKQMVSDLLNGTLYFSGTTTQCLDRPFGFAIEPIPENQYGELYLGGITAALIDTVADSTHKFVKIVNETSNETATKILKTTPVKGLADYYAVLISSDNGSEYGITKQLAYLVAKQKSGHLSGTTGDSIGSNTATTVVTVEETLATTKFTDTIVGVTCPLLDGDSIKAHSVVIVSWNDSVDNWQIIEAQC